MGPQSTSADPHAAGSEDRRGGQSAAAAGRRPDRIQRGAAAHRPAALARARSGVVNIPAWLSPREATSLLVRAAEALRRPLLQRLRNASLGKVREAGQYAQEKKGACRAACGAAGVRVSGPYAAWPHSPQRRGRRTQHPSNHRASKIQRVTAARRADTGSPRRAPALHAARATSSPVGGRAEHRGAHTGARASERPAKTNERRRQRVFSPSGPPERASRRSGTLTGPRAPRAASLLEQPSPTARTRLPCCTSLAYSAAPGARGCWVIRPRAPDAGTRSSALASAWRPAREAQRRRALGRAQPRRRMGSRPDTPRNVDEAHVMVRFDFMGRLLTSLVRAAHQSCWCAARGAGHTAHSHGRTASATAPQLDGEKVHRVATCRAGSSTVRGALLAHPWHVCSKLRGQDVHTHVLTYACSW